MPGRMCLGRMCLPLAGCIWISRVNKTSVLRLCAGGGQSTGVAGGAPPPPPPPDITPEWEPDLQHVLGEAPLSVYQGKWDSLMAAQQADALWGFWTWAVEESLLALSRVSLTDLGQVDSVRSLPRVSAELLRGTWLPLKRVSMCPRQRCVTGVPKTTPLACLEEAVWALWIVVLRGRLDKGLAIMHRTGCLPTFNVCEAAPGILANSVAL